MLGEATCFSRLFLCIDVNLQSICNLFAIYDVWRL